MTKLIIGITVLGSRPWIMRQDFTTKFDGSPININFGLIFHTELDRGARKQVKSQLPIELPKWQLFIFLFSEFPLFKEHPMYLNEIMGRIHEIVIRPGENIIFILLILRCHSLRDLNQVWLSLLNQHRLSSLYLFLDLSFIIDWVGNSELLTSGLMDLLLEDVAGNRISCWRLGVDDDGL